MTNTPAYFGTKLIMTTKTWYRPFVPHRTRGNKLIMAVKMFNDDKLKKTYLGITYKNSRTKSRAFIETVI